VECRAELRSLKEIYPKYQDRVTLLAIAYDPTEEESFLESFRQQQGYPFRFYRPQGDMLARFGVRIRDTKLVVGRDGVIILREGYASRPAWVRVFEQLVGS